MIFFLDISNSTNANDLRSIKRLKYHQKRTALVIGNGKYVYGRLKNPTNDARDMANTLRKLEFIVTLILDVNGRLKMSHFWS